MANENLFVDKDEVLPILDDNKDYYPELVGEGKKFKDNSALAKKAVASDIAILQRERENKALRDEMTNLRNELKTRTSIEEFLDKMNTSKKPDENEGTSPAESAGSITNEQIEALIEAKLNSKAEESVSDRNFTEVQEGLLKSLGSDYPQKLKVKAQELGLGEKFLNDLARSSPKAFFTVIGVKSEESVFAPKTKVTSLGSTGSTVKNKKYYDTLKKTLKPEEFWSGKIQNEMFEQAAELGDDFYT